MRILFLTQYYPPETGAAPLRAYHFATNLAKRGHAVTVVTGMPNHPSGVKQPRYRRKLACREEVDGVRILRCYLFATPRKTFFTRVANQLSFMITAAVGGCAAGKCDLVLVSSPPLFLGLTAWFLGLVRGVPFVLDLRDYWPHAAVELGELRSRRAIRAAESLEQFLYRRAARLVAVTPGMERLMLERGIPRHRISLITNGADTELFAPAAGGPAGNGGDGRTVIYSGTHGLVHGMDVILEAAEILRDESDARFVLVGDGVAKQDLVRQVDGRGLRNVEFLPSKQPDELSELVHRSALCLATTRSGEFSASTIPVKLFDYMACGKPVVAAVEGDAREIVERAGSGIVTKPGDGRGLAEAVKTLLGDAEMRHTLGRSGRVFVEDAYSRTALAGKLEELLEEILASERALCGSHLKFRYYLGVKYLLDVLTAFGILIVGAPLHALLAIAVRLDSPGHAHFTQRRIGVYSQEFTILKLRTMHRETPDLATDLMNHSQMKDGCVTKFGWFLRRTSADEYPNLVNVLRGEMSVVGPRPALYNQYELIELRRQVGVDLVRPGLTGWAQINGRDEIDLEEKVRLDRFYVENCSLLLDLRILLGTFGALRRSRGEESGPRLSTEEQR
jgi:lipopolysaccharide/colanic/teichoic acid biosynthesis glycosyltransferase